MALLLVLHIYANSVVKHPRNFGYSTKKHVVYILCTAAYSPKYIICRSVGVDRDTSNISMGKNTILIGVARYCNTG